MILRRIVLGLRALLTRARVERDLDDELRAYLDTSIRQKVAAGMAPEEAARAARVELGSSLDAVKDYTRDASWESALDTLSRDVRYALRTLRKSRAFSAVAIVTLALGIGATTAIFSVVNAVLLRELPVERPQELISFAAVSARGADATFSYAAYRQFADEGAAVADAIAASASSRTVITIDGRPEPVMHKRVSGNYFTTLGIEAAAGRTLLPADDRLPQGELVAVISDAFRARRFAREPSVVGRSFRLNAATFTIVGVAPRTFFGESIGEAPDLWTPLTAQPGAPPFLWRGHSTTWLGVMARLRPGVTLAQAQAALDPVYRRIRADVAAGMERPEWRKSALESRLGVFDASGGFPRLRNNFALPLQILLGLVGLVLVIVCANVATLTLARAAGRQRETALCLAIGAGRVRLIRQLLTEALVLAALGGAAGVLLAFWGTSALAAIAERTALSISIDLAPDMRVLVFATFVSCATAVLFGLLPALRAARIDPLAALKGAGGSTSFARVPFGRTLVVMQIAVSLVLLITAALFVRSLLNLTDIDPGFDPDGVLVLQMTPPTNDPPVAAEERRTLYRALLERAEAVPGVLAASASVSGLFTDGTWGNAITVDGFAAPPGQTPRTFANAIAHRYFEVMGIALASGRAFTERDDERAPLVTVVNQAFARQFFGDGNPIGRRVGLGFPAKVMMEIVGVTKDAKYVTLREQSRPMLYVPFTQYGPMVTLRQLEVRTAGDPAPLAATLARELTAVDPRVAIVASVGLRDQVDASLAVERLIARLSAAFGLLALALAAVGLYGVIAYVTSQRTGEIGIRMALGGDRRHVRWLVGRDTTRLVLIGVAIGLPIALAGARLLASQLYEVGPADPIALLLGVATLSLVALVAGYVPARRAARVNPLVALRSE